MPSSQSAYIFGDINAQVGGSTVVSNQHTGNTFTINGLGDRTLVLSDMVIDGTAAAADGINITASHAWVIERVWITNHGGNGLNAVQCYGGHLRDASVYGNRKNGCQLLQCNNITILNPKIIANGLDGLTNHSGIWINGQASGTACINIRVIGGNIESNGSGPSGFGIGVLFAKTLMIAGVYFEGNVNLQVWMDTTVQGLYFCNNFFLGDQPTIGATGGVIHANCFQSGTEPLLFSGTNQCLDVCGNTFIGAPVTSYGTSGCFERVEASMSAPPVAGTWAVGAKVWNSAPATGQPLGWVCTAPGTPGTWRPMANLA